MLLLLLGAAGEILGVEYLIVVGVHFAIAMVEGRKIAIYLLVCQVEDRTLAV